MFKGTDIDRAYWRLLGRHRVYRIFRRLGYSRILARAAVEIGETAQRHVDGLQSDPWPSLALKPRAMVFPVARPALRWEPAIPALLNWSPRIAGRGWHFAASVMLARRSVIAGGGWYRHFWWTFQTYGGR